MRSPTCIVSTLRRWRLFSPWIVKPCSRVFRKLSGELTIIQNWEARPSVRPDFRLRRGRPDLTGRSPVGAAGVSGVSDVSDVSGVSGVSDTRVIVCLLRQRRRGRGQLLRLRQQDGQVPDLGDVRDLVAGHHPAHLQEGDVAGARGAKLAIPLAFAPAVQEVDRPAADAGEVLESLLEGAGELVLEAGIDGRAHIRGGH